ALVGLAVAPGSLHPVTAFTALLCIAVGAGADGALNMWYDADIDAVMSRTERRTVPMGRVLTGEALSFRLTLAGFAWSTRGVRVGGDVVGRCSSCVYDLLLRRGLHGLAQAIDAAEHSDRRRGRGFSADDRLGGGHGVAVA